eukprot:40209_1
MIYFNIMFYEENINMKWKIIINYSMNAKNKKFNWFLVHKQTYGALKWLTPRIITVFMSMSCALIFTQFYDQLIASVLDGILSFLAIPILLLLWYKTPMMDHFEISMEYIYIIVLCLIEWCVYFGGCLLNTIVFTSGNIIAYYDPLTFLLVESWTGVLFAFCIVIICTKWTLHKCNTTPKHKLASSSATSLRSLSSRSIAHVNSTSSVRQQPTISRRNTTRAIISPRGKNLKLFECLQCDHGFNCFMNHLMREFSHECLLSTLEFIQFKKGLSCTYTDMLGANQLSIPHLNINDKSGDCGSSSSCSEDTPPLSPMSPEQPPSLLITTISVLSAASVSDCSSVRSSHNLHSHHSKREILACQFPECVPQSFIVFKSNADKYGASKEEVLREYKMKAHHLFEKYIYNGHGECLYEININYNMRKRLIHLMRNKEEWICEGSNNVSFDELYTLFDDCILEMYDLMCHSFARFKKTQEFAKLDRKIFCKSSFPHAHAFIN